MNPQEVTPPGTSIVAHRPPPLSPYPIPAILVSIALVTGAIVIVACANTKPPFLPVIPAAVAISVLIIQISIKAKEESYQKIVSSVGAITDAWSGLKAASGISRAIDINITYIRDQVGPRCGWKWRNVNRQVEDIERRLRRVRTADYPITHESLRGWSRDRYDEVVRLNQEIVQLGKKCGFGADLQRNSVKRRSERLEDVYEKWESAINCAQVESRRWKPISNLLDYTSRLVKYWWIIAINDPAYAISTEGGVGRERKRSFKKADMAVSALEYVIVHRKLGQSWWRLMLIRFAVGGRTVGLIDHLNR